MVVDIDVGRVGEGVEGAHHIALDERRQVMRVGRYLALDRVEVVVHVAERRDVLGPLILLPGRVDVLSSLVQEVLLGVGDRARHHVDERLQEADLRGDGVADRVGVLGSVGCGDVERVDVVGRALVDVDHLSAELLRDGGVLVLGVDDDHVVVRVAQVGLDDAG